MQKTVPDRAAPHEWCPKQDIPEREEGRTDFPDRETAAAMERMFWVFSLCFRYPARDVYLRLRDSRRLLDNITFDAASRAAELPDLQGMQAEYVRLMVNNYGHVPAPPYASCYLNREGLLLGSVQRELRRIMRDAGREPRDDVGEPADHIHLLLEFCAEMAGSVRRGESAEQSYAALRRVVREAVAPMAEPFCDRIVEHAQYGLYRDIALAFRELVREVLCLLDGEGESRKACDQEEALCNPE